MVEVKELLREHLKELTKAISAWERYEKTTLNEFLRDEDKQNMIFHGMLRGIQAAIDIGNDIIAMKNLEEPSTYKEIFEILERNKIISSSLAFQLSTLAGFRNALVHIYWKVDTKRAHKILRTKKKPLKQFHKICLKYLKA